MPLPLQVLPRIYYGWWVALATLGVRGAGAGVFVWSFSVMIPPLEAEFGWSRAEVSAAVSVSLLVAGLCGPLAGRWTDRRGSRSLIMAGSTVTAFSLAFLAGTASLWHLYLGYGAMAVGRVGLAYIPLNSLVARWFGRNRGLALGVSAAGMGVGGFLFAPLTSRLVSELGWRGSYLALAAILWGVVFPLALWVIRDGPGQLPEHERSPNEPATPTSVAPSAIVRTRSFWLLCGVFAMIFFSQFAVNVHGVPFLIQRGLSFGDAAVAVGLAAGMSVAGRLAVGVVADRWLAPTTVLMLGLLVQANVLVIALLLPVEWLPLLWVVGLGLTTGVAGTLEGLIIIQVFGTARLGTLQGLIGITETASVIFGPILAGYLYDVRGDYVASFGLFALSNLLALLGVWAGRRWGLFARR